MRRKKSLRLLGKKEAKCREKWRQSSRWLINVAAKLELWGRREYTCWRPQMTVAWKVCLSQLPICQHFGLKTKAEYPEIATKAMKTLLSFPTSYLSEAGFSAVKATKTQWRSRLDIRSTLQVTLSPVTPGWDRLLAEKQVQGSYWFCVNGGWYFFYFVALCVCYHADFILFPHKLCETLHWILTPSAHLINPANVIREDVCSLCEKNMLCLCLSCTRLISHRAVEVKSSHAIRLRPVLTRVLMPNVNWRGCELSDCDRITQGGCCCQGRIPLTVFRWEKRNFGLLSFFSNEASVSVSVHAHQHF